MGHDQFEDPTRRAVMAGGTAAVLAATYGEAMAQPNEINRMGGAALVTPMLVLLFGINPATAVSSDVVAAAAMPPVSRFVSARRMSSDRRTSSW